MIKYTFLLFFLILLGCSKRSELIIKKLDSLSGIEQPNQIANNIEVVFVDSNFTKAILKSKQARIYNKTNTTYLDSSVSVEFLSKISQKRMSILTSDSAKIDDITKDMTAMGNVIVNSDSSGIRLETNILQWNNSRQKIYSNEFVRITTKNEFISGYGFESNPDLSNYKILKVSGIQTKR